MMKVYFIGYFRAVTALALTQPYADACLSCLTTIVTQITQKTVSNSREGQ